MSFYRIRGNPKCEIRINDDEFEIIDDEFAPNSMTINFNKVNRIEIEEKKQTFYMIIATMMLDVFSNIGLYNPKEKSSLLKNSTAFTIFFNDNRSTKVEILNAFEPGVRTAVKKLNEIFEAKYNS